MEYPSTPTLDRMLEARDESQTIGEFLDWLINGKRYAICEWLEPSEDEMNIGVVEGYYQVPYSIERFLAEYFDIDMAQVERERMAILEHIRSLQDEN